MGSINLKELAQDKNIKYNSYIYSDLHFDLRQTQRNVSNTNNIKAIKGKDIEISTNLAAIQNSIFNILKTRQGQRFLLPNFGCNLLGLVGQPVTTTNGKQIGSLIYNALRVWEPRIKVDDVLVVGKPDLNEYDITITITIPSLKQTDIKVIEEYINKVK